MNGYSVRLHAFGQPESVLRYEPVSLPPPGSREVVVELAYAPINPADLNVIEGTYGSLPSLPATVGMEGVGVVAQTGADVQRLRPGQRVILLDYLGTWSTLALCHEDQLFPVPDDVPFEQAAMLKVNPSTAWRMLRDFVDLKPGDWIIQNAANSGVGHAVIQIAKAQSIRTVNLVRREEVVGELKRAGADVVVVEPDGITEAVIEDMKGVQPRLALNAVGGKSAKNLMKVLAVDGCMVTYGGMAREPISVGAGQLIFRNLRVVGFWISSWYRTAGADEREEMFANLLQLCRAGALHAPVEKAYPLNAFQEAITHAAGYRRNGKILISMVTF